MTCAVRPGRARYDDLALGALRVIEQVVTVGRGVGDAACPRFSGNRTWCGTRTHPIGVYVCAAERREPFLVRSTIRRKTQMQGLPGAL
ncbi:hypothetical protein [Streptomyces sp. NBC_00151]|uniref:hypothetical protein n=1 Tax=Streptomyces sp. NBC_00151 TaxID=2975669 RepID=UPI002DD814E7|nr:hypothetical protein [Streptomyces sp. NBC_00151]WRZ43564.1 hypothetical protein OG915_39290 [Streptomyces sp. NBC_00151]